MSNGEGDAIRFAERLLALLEEGSFTATYKFAVLLGLMDLCLEHSNRFGEPPDSVTTTQLAHKVIELYWHQTAPFEPEAGLVLRQNSGPPAVILSAIRQFRDRWAPDPGCTLHRARLAAPEPFARLVDQVEWTLVLMPLPKVQRFGGREERFVYDIGWDDDVKKGTWRDTHAFDNRIWFVGDAARHLVRLTPLLRPLIQQRWTEMVGRLNGLEVARVESFLFGASRTALAPVRTYLTELQSGGCFYCGGRLRAAGEVDHFLPWSRHPDDRLDNLVVAHRRCNGDKRDFLASAAHLRRWAERLDERERELRQIADDVGWPRETVRTLGVVRGTYLRLPDEVTLWQGVREFVPARHAELVRALGAAPG